MKMPETNDVVGRYIHTWSSRSIVSVHPVPFKDPSCPLDCEGRRLQELFIGVLFDQIQPSETSLGYFFDEKLVARDQLLLCEARVENKCLVLVKKKKGQLHKKANEEESYPVASQHYPRRVHPDSGHQTRALHGGIDNREVLLPPGICKASLSGFRSHPLD